jgi:hypothetical protein
MLEDSSSMWCMCQAALATCCRSVLQAMTAMISSYIIAAPSASTTAVGCGVCARLLWQPLLLQLQPVLHACILVLWVPVTLSHRSCVPGRMLLYVAHAAAAANANFHMLPACHAATAAKKPPQDSSNTRRYIKNLPKYPSKSMPYLISRGTAAHHLLSVQSWRCEGGTCHPLLFHAAAPYCPHSPSRPLPQRITKCVSCLPGGSVAGSGRGLTRDDAVPMLQNCWGDAAVLPAAAFRARRHTSVSFWRQTCVFGLLLPVASCLARAAVHGACQQLLK